MNNKDFQNGLIVGLASKQNSNSVLSEEFVYEQLAEFKEKEIDYIKQYSYNFAEFEGKVTSENKPIVEPTISYIKTNEGGSDAWRISIKCILHMFKQVSDNSIECLVDTPLTPKMDGVRMDSEFTNRDSIVDFGFTLINGETNKFNHDLSDMVDGVNFYKGKFETYDAIGNWSDSLRELDLVCELSLYTHDQELAETMTEEYNYFLKNGYVIDFVFWHRNQPYIETINAHYIGGN